MILRSHTLKRRSVRCCPAVEGAGVIHAEIVTRSTIVILTRPGVEQDCERCGRRRCMNELINIKGFTNAMLGWDALADGLFRRGHTGADHCAGGKSTKAKESDYYLFRVHQPEILRQRSAAFNAIMYAPQRYLPRAERAASTVVSRINGCVYCASVHAQRAEQLAKRDDVIREVFDDPATAGTTDRAASAIVRFSDCPDRCTGSCGCSGYPAVEGRGSE